MASNHERLVQEAFHLAERGAIAMAAQDKFAALYLDAEQGQRYREICLRVRQAGLNARQLLDEIAACIDRR